MVKFTPGNLSPDALPRVRGQFLAQKGAHGWHIQKWPRKRGANQHPNSQWTAAQFAIAADYAAHPISLDLGTAIEMTKGTDWVPRDILMRAIYGKAYQVFNADGTQWTVNPHSPPPPRRAPVTQWQFNIFDAVDDTQSSATAFAFKGQQWTPQVAATLVSVLVRLTTVVNATYKVVLCTVDVGLNILTVQSSTSFIAATTARRWREVELAASLVAGTTYAILVGRTSGAANYVLPIQYNTVDKSQWPMIPANGVRIASVNPAVGNTLQSSGNVVVPMGLLLDY